MSTRFLFPRAGSRAHTALVALQRCSGATEFRAWMTAAGWNESIREFERAIERLQIAGLVSLEAGHYSLTSRALDELGVAADAPVEAAPVVVGPRQHFPSPTLSPRHMLRMTSMREGAFDYISIPSRMGDLRRPHVVTSSSDGVKISE